MIKAVRTDESRNRQEPIGFFTALGPNPVIGTEECLGSYGVSYL